MMWGAGKPSDVTQDDAMCLSDVIRYDATCWSDVM